MAVVQFRHIWFTLKAILSSQIDLVFHIINVPFVMLSFAEAQQAMIAYLDSDEFITREDAEDTVPNRAKLQKLCSLGLITVDSQQGSKNDQYQYVERAYVFGFMRPVMAEQVNQDLARNQSDKMFLILPVSHIADTREQRIPLTIDRNKMATSSSTHIEKPYFDFGKSNARIRKSEKVVFVLCFDPVWARPATSPHGLYKDLMKALTAH